MKKESALVTGAAVVLVGMISIGLIVPGAINAQESDKKKAPDRVGIREVNIAPGETTGETAELNIETRIYHEGSESKNVSLLIRAVNLDTGMVETTSKKEIGNLKKDAEKAVDQTITVGREGGYRIKTILFKDGKRVAEGSKNVKGVGTLKPEYSKSSVRFHDFNAFPAVEYSIKQATNETAVLETTAYVTNNGDKAPRGISVTVKARQADSMIIADEKRVEVGAISPGETKTATVELEVPNGYNYYLDSVLWKKDVVIETTRSVANLNPTKEVKKNFTEKKVGIDVSEFEKEDEYQQEKGRRERAREIRNQSEGGSGGQPGFGVLVALVALIVVIGVGYRKTERQTESQETRKER